MTEPFAVPVADLADPSPPPARRRLPLRLGLDRSRPALGGRDIRRVLPTPHRAVATPGAVVTHVKFRGLDGFSSVITIEDALDHDVLLADHLDGERLGNDHGAPLRVVSPTQYGYKSTKHLSRIDVHTAAPTGGPRSFVLDVLLHSSRGPGSGKKSATERCPAP